MSDKSVEMYNVDRPNRFQVNRVNSDCKDRKEIYRKINESDDEDGKCDTFAENEVVIRRQSRILSIKSSFRDKDKPSKYKDLQTTRFENIDRDSDSNDEDRESLLDNDYDTKYGKSFRHFTREALPRMDNYRNMLSIQAACRPTLDELHNNTLPNKVSRTLSRNFDQEAGVINNGILKFGWIQGVLIRCLLNIWGVMLFLRLSWVVGQAGIIEATVLILTTTAVTGITALSMSAISTNGVVKGGGAYYMISRSLGPEFGGSIGLIFSLANAVACAMYVVGFCESMNDLLESFGVQIVDGNLQDVRIIGVITIIILTVIVVFGLDWEAKAQIGLLVILVVAIFDYLIGSFVGPKSDSELARGFVGYNATVWSSNVYSDYREHGGVKHDFFSVFAIFFPAATGILAGANISGDLKDPQKSIPKGTILAIFITTTTYIIMVLVAGGTIARDATGNIDDVVNGSWTFLNCSMGNCSYGLQNSFQVIELGSGFGPFIYAGCFAATLSSALASLVSAPKVFQALCKDELFPKIKWFAKGFGKNDEPVRGYVLTFILATGFILIAELNVIAPLISNFFLAAYMLINFSTFYASLVRPIGWRPRFKYYNMWLSLLGAILCVAVMFLISWGTALITFSVVIALYLIVSYRKPDVNWGSTNQAQTYKNALLSVQKLNNTSEHVKNYRPQILVLSDLPSTRPILVDFAYLLTKNISLLVCGHISKGICSQKHRNHYQQRANEWFKKNNVKAFYSFVDGESFESGSRALLQAAGIGKLKPNVLLMGYKSNWKTCERSELVEYFNTIHKAFDIHLAVAILRLEKGLDYSQILGETILIKDHEKAKPVNGDKSSDLNLTDRSKMHDSCDSLDKSISEASSASDLSTSYNVSNKPDPIEDKSQQGVSLGNYIRKGKKSNKETSLFHKARDSVDLSKNIQQELSQFTRKRSEATIDVYWLYDDGGLTLLLPYIISTRRNWNSCKLRIFALANKQDELEVELSSMASLLAKFRIDYSDLQLIPDITKKPQESTTQFFDGLISDFMETDPESEGDDLGKISPSSVLAVKDKTNRHLRLREYLLENSSKSDLVVMTLPMPKKNIVTAPLYMAWLECLSRGLPPFLFVRGNQTSVLTFYS